MDDHGKSPLVEEQTPPQAAPPKPKPKPVAKKKTALTATPVRRSSTGQSVNTDKHLPSVSVPLRKSLPQMTTSKNSGLVSPGARTMTRTPTSSGPSKNHSANKLSLSPTTNNDSSTTASSITKNSVSKIAKPSVKRQTKPPSPSSLTGSRSLSMSRDRSSSLSNPNKLAAPQHQDSRFVPSPQLEVKAADDVRLDLRGRKIHRLKGSGLNLSQNLEFVYLRDNLLSSLEGIEVLTRVKVLDLSFNDFKGHGFEPLGNCQVLQQLYLAGNQITSLSTLPELPSLEFLSVAQNKLKSLSMASQPRLQVLAASKNKISSLKGFPHLPVLEHLRVEENPILRMRHLEAASILLVGPTLKKFNDKDLSKEEVALAKRYPAHTALCIKNGWEFCLPELALESTFHFLIEHWKDQLPPGFQLQEASIDPPFEEDACRCHFIFLKDHGIDSNLVLKYQWYIGERTLSSFKIIPDAISEVYIPSRDDVGKYLKVECIPASGETEFPPVFAISSPVSPGTGCPKVLNLNVSGDLVEGNVIRGCAEVAWCGGTPGKGVASWLRRKWNSTPVVIAGAEDEEYQLLLDDVDSSLVFMYTPMTKEGMKGEPQYSITDFIKAAPPSVSNVQIIGDYVEGNTIKGEGTYFGGQEGPSKYEWLRENKDSRGYDLVLTGTAEYTLTKDDVGNHVAFKYIPVNFEGREGEPSSVVSNIIKQAPPRVINLRIIGELREGNKVTITGTVTGGTESASRVQWFKSSYSSFSGENGLEALSMSKIAKAIRIPLGAVGHYVVAKFTPMTPDGEAGEPAYVISERTVETLPPSLNFLSITGDYAEGEMLTASYGYIGGHEGKSIYNWYLHEVETAPGTLVHEASGHLQYRIPKTAIGKFVSFKCTPARDDGTIGEPRICIGQERVRAGTPRLTFLQVSGTSVEGSTLVADKIYWGGDEGDSVFRWFRTDSEGKQTEINGATTSMYSLSIDDIGCFVSVSCEPVRSDWARGPTVLSEQLGPVLPGLPTCEELTFEGSMIEGERLSFSASYSGGTRGNCWHEWFRVRKNGDKEKLSAHDCLVLALDDVGCCIQVTFTPVRNDGIIGIPKSAISDVIMPADPVGLELTLPSCCEAEEVIPFKRYFGGKESEGGFIWYRTKDKLEESVLSSLSDGCANISICGRDLAYTPCLDDVGGYLALQWVPIREDGKLGKPLNTICRDPVTPAHPAVTKVTVRALDISTYYGEGQYFGGHEGSSLFSWYRESLEGTLTLINGANSQTYEVADPDYNCRLLFGYTPVRSDSVVGELQLSDPTDIILPEPLQIEMVALTGKAEEGDVLTAVAVIPKGERQQVVWSQYKKDVLYQWYSSEPGDANSLKVLSSQHSCSYKLCFEDISCILRCECIVTDVFGRASEPVFVDSTPILPGTPRIDKLEIEGRGFHTNLYAVRGVYSGGREGKSRIQWLRSMVGSPDLISLPGETGRMYEANVDDVGYRLVAVYTPVREDGIEGRPVSASTEPIAVEPDVLEEVKKKLDLGSVKFEVLCDKAPSSKKVFEVGGLERRILEINRKRVKVVKPGSKTSFPTTEMRGTYAPPFHVELFRNDQHRLRVVFDGEHEVDIMVHTRHLRDVIVLVVRGLAQKFNSVSLNSLLQIES
ncbi:187-kDa microtubule-associated protein AIR9 [Silene latifolia]|uniref:187-kDa microtubule-associated protein AIR9 n=1 Tax=Silene latifolia TaxID=37657 RepID=UPI003D7861BD